MNTPTREFSLADLAYKQEARKYVSRMGLLRYLDDDVIEKEARKRGLLPSVPTDEVLSVPDLTLYMHDRVAVWHHARYALRTQQRDLLAVLMRAWPQSLTQRAVFQTLSPGLNYNDSASSMRTTRIDVNRLMPRIIGSTGCRIPSLWYLDLEPGEPIDLSVLRNKRVSFERTIVETRLGPAHYIKSKKEGSRDRSDDAGSD